MLLLKFSVQLTKHLHLVRGWKALRCCLHCRRQFCCSTLAVVAERVAIEYSEAKFLTIVGLFPPKTIPKTKQSCYTKTASLMCSSQGFFSEDPGAQKATAKSAGWKKKVGAGTPPEGWGVWPAAGLDPAGSRKKKTKPSTPIKKIEFEF